MSITSDQVNQISSSGGNVVSVTGEKIGRIGQVYLDDQTGEPAWVTVKTGLLGTSESFVPLLEARLESGNLVVDYPRDTVTGAPRVADDGAISPEEAQRLSAYYHLSGPNSGGGGGGMIRSEERLRVGVQRRATERVRIRKYVVTEEVTQTVLLRREEFRVEREPIADGSGTPGPSSETEPEEYEIILHAERPVIQTEIVPVERIRVRKERVTGEVTVSENLRKEQIETDIQNTPDSTDNRTAGR